MLLIGCNMHSQSAEEAVEQIKKRNYSKVLEEKCREVLLVGINYDRSSKKHECIIEKAAVGTA